MKPDKKKIINLIGKILIIISLVFISIQLYKYKINLSIFSDIIFIFLFILLALFQGILTFLPPFNYNFILRTICQKKISFSKVTYTYLKSNLYKYLPGNVMHYVGRNQLAVDEEIPHSEVIFSTVSEILFILISGSAVTLILAYKYLFKWFEKNNISVFFYLIILILIIVLIILIFIFRNKIKEKLNKYKEILIKKGIKTALFSILFYSVHFLLSGTLFSILFILVCGQVEFPVFISIAGLSVMAWIVGFITPGVPGGIGVREAVMTMFLSGTSSQDKIITAVVLYRIVCVIGDLAAYLFAVAFKKISENFKLRER